MKKSAIIILVVLCTCLTFPLVNTAKITRGEVYYSLTHYLAGNPIPTGFDIFGYNYQGHMFKGYYCNAYLGGAGLPPYTGSIDDYPAGDLAAFQAHWTYPYRDVWLTMKWNDAWISNQDRDDDGSLDRHWGYPTYDGSGAWLTNHQWENFKGYEEGINWNYFVKIVTPSTAEGDYVSGGLWYNSDDVEIGPVIWGSFAVIMRIYNEEGAVHGVEYLSPASAGFGYYD